MKFLNTKEKIEIKMIFSSEINRMYLIDKRILKKTECNFSHKYHNKYLTPLARTLIT